MAVHATAVTASRNMPAATGQLSVRRISSCYNCCAHSLLGPIVPVVLVCLLSCLWTDFKYESVYFFVMQFHVWEHVFLAKAVPFGCIHKEKLCRGQNSKTWTLGAEISVLRQIFESGYRESYKFTEFLLCYAQNLKVGFCLSRRLSERFGVIK